MRPIVRRSLCSFSLLAIFALFPACDGSFNIGTVWPVETNAEVDSPVELYCSLDLNHTDVVKNNWSSSALGFFRPNGTLYPVDDGSVKAVNESTVKFTRETSSTSDSGAYYCNVRRKDGSRRNVGAGQIFIGFRPTPPEAVRCVSYDLQALTCSWVPPSNPIRTKYAIFFRLNSRAMIDRRFNCPAARFARSICTWRMDSDPPFMRRPLLHFGFEASNKLANETFEQVYSFNLYENFKPAPVSNLTITPVDSHSIELTWSLSVFMRFTDVHLNHSIRWRPMSCGDGIWNEIIVQLEHGSKHRYELKNLPFANERYEVAVQAIPKDAAFDDLWSDPTVAFDSTLPTLPETPVVNDASYEVVMSSVDNERTIVAYWVKPDVCRQNGENFRHRVQLVHDGSVVDEQETDGTTTRAEFSRVRSDLDYDVVVTAVNDVGPSSEAARIHVVAHEDSPRLPYSVSSILHAGGVYEVSWRSPEPIGEEITSFTVFFCEQESPVPNRCDGRMGWVQVPPTTTRYNLTDLDPSVSYHFAIAVNSKSASSGMAWATCTVEYNHIKRPLRHVWIKSRTSNSVSLAWRHECQSSFGLISASNIRYCKVQSCDDMCVSEQRLLRVAGDWENGTVRGLEPFSMYKFTVGVESRAGESPPNDPPICGKTDEGAPSGPPLDVTVVDVDENSVEIVWTSPEFVNGVVHSSIIRVNNEEVTLGGNATSWRVMELESYRNYSFSVQTCTKKGQFCSPMSQEVFARTEMSEPGQMSLPWGRFLNSTAILVFWDPPEEPNGPIAFYELNVTVVSGTGVEQTYLGNQSSGQQAEVAVPECNPSTDLQYSVNVRAVNQRDDGELLAGPWSTIGLVNCGGGVSSETLVGLIVGCSLTVLAVVLLGLIVGRKVRRKWVEMATIDVKMPEKFGDVSGYNASLQPRPAVEEYQERRMAYLRVDSNRLSSEDGSSLRGRNWSGSTEESRLEKTSLWSDRKRLSTPDDAISTCSAHESDETASAKSRNYCASDSGMDTKLGYYGEPSGYSKIAAPTDGEQNAELRKRTPSPAYIGDRQHDGRQGYVTVGCSGSSAQSSAPSVELHPAYCQIGTDSAYVDYSGMSSCSSGAPAGYVAVGYENSARATSVADSGYVIENVVNVPPKAGLVLCPDQEDVCVLDGDDEDDEDIHVMLGIDEGDLEVDVDTPLGLGLLSPKGKIAPVEIREKKPRTVDANYVLS